MSDNTVCCIYVYEVCFTNLLVEHWFYLPVVFNSLHLIANKMEELTRFIHKLHYRTFDKIWPHVQEKFPQATEEQVRAVIKGFVKDPPKLKVKQYFNRIFSDHPHAWMMDLLDNSGTTPEYNNKAEVESEEMKKEYPIYWIIFINVNTRYAAAYPLYHKDTAHVIEVLRQFLSEHKCSSLTSDKESAFIAKETSTFLKQRNISQYIVLDNNHTSLAIIDSFIRHLRDRNITNEKSKYQSHHSKYRNFSTKRMKQLLDIYNNTIHSTTGLKPIDMQNDIKLERQYIAYCLIHKQKKKSHDIPTNHFVRVVLSKDIMKKRRFKVSRECYKITGREGYNYIISAADHTSTTLPRHRLIDLGSTKPDKYKLADTIPNALPSIESIISKNKTGGLLVNYANDAGAKEVRQVDLRRHHPQVMSKVEREFKTKQVK